MAKQVNKYRLTWNVEHGRGKIELKFVNSRSKKVLLFTNGMEFQTVSNILQNEDPVYYDPENITLYTDDELVMDDD